MTTRNQPPDPPAGTTAAEAAYLAARRTVRAGPRRTRADPSAGGRPAAAVPDPPVAQRPSRTRAPVALAAAVAAGAAGMVTLAPVAAVVVLLEAAEAGELALTAPVQVAVAGWLLSHGVPLQIGSGMIGLLPLTLTALAAWRLARAGVHVTRAIGARQCRSWRRALLASGTTGLAYGVLGLLAAAAAGGGWWAEPLRAGATFTVFGFLAASYGSLRATGVMAVLTMRLPVLVRDGARTGAVAALLVLAAGAVAAGSAVALRGGAAAEILAAYGTGVAGQAGLTLVCLAYAPNLAVWAAAYLLGPGFAVGAGTVVRSSEVAVGPLPALPVLAGLPDGPLPEVGAALLVVVTLIGAVAGWLLGRRWDLRPSWPALLGRALLAGPVAGVLLALAAALAAGAAGGGQLATLGPVAWQVAAFAAALITPGVVLGVVAGVWFTRRS